MCDSFPTGKPVRRQPRLLLFGVPRAPHCSECRDMPRPLPSRNEACEIVQSFCRECESECFFFRRRLAAKKTLRSRVRFLLNGALASVASAFKRLHFSEEDIRVFTFF